MPPRPAINAADAANTELTIRSLYQVLTLVSIAEITAIGTQALKNVWLNSNTDEAASSKAQWARFRERTLHGFISQLAPIAWDLAMAYALMRIATDDTNNTDLEALGFAYSNTDFPNELVCPLWTWLHVHTQPRATFSCSAWKAPLHSALAPTPDVCNRWLRHHTPPATAATCLTTAPVPVARATNVATTDPVPPNVATTSVATTDPAPSAPPTHANPTALDLAAPTTATRSRPSGSPWTLQPECPLESGRTGCPPAA